jgi:phospholipase C
MGSPFSRCFTDTPSTTLLSRTYRLRSRRRFWPPPRRDFRHRVTPTQHILPPIVLNRKINHVILLCLENRSFDQILGYRSAKPSPLKVDGINSNNICWKLDEEGKKVSITSQPIVPYIGGDSVANDLAANDYSTECDPPMSGFVLAHQKDVYDTFGPAIPNDRVDPKHIMGHFPEGSIPIFDFLSDNYTVCDRWFCSVPAQTIPNRTFMLCGTSQGKLLNHRKEITNEDILFTGDTIFDRLNDQKVEWKTYFGDFPISLTLTHQHTPDNLKRYAPLSNIYDDINNGTLPPFSFIEPHYRIESQASSKNNIGYEEELVRDIYNALIANPTIWEQTLFIINYDENGGRYDHVIPPAAISPDTIEGESFSTESTHSTKFKFDRYGCRVPAILISPWIKAGVSSTIYDHTSVLAFLEENFNLKPLTHRDANATTFTTLFTDTLRKDIPLPPPVKVNPTNHRLECWDLQFVNAIMNTVIKLEIVTKEINADLHKILRR